MVANGSNTAVAIAGIAATALVGIAGSGASFLIAKQDRSSERHLAREARVFDARTAVHVDALEATGRVREWISNPTYASAAEGFTRARALALLLDRRLLARVSAFGSPDVARTYRELYVIGTKMDRLPAPPKYEDQKQHLFELRRAFSAQSGQFEGLVRNDLGTGSIG